MNLKLLCLIPLSISAAFGLYVFLQTNSETAQQQQGEISLYITQLEKMDLQLEKQLLVTDSFYFRNYDALNSAYYQYRQTLQNPPVLPATLASSLPVIRTRLEAKFSLIEELKTRHSELRNSLNYTPGLLEQVLLRLYEDHRLQRLDKPTLNQYHKYLRYRVVNVLFNQLIDYQLRRSSPPPASSLNTEEARLLWESIMQHLNRMGELRQQLIGLHGKLQQQPLQTDIEAFSKLFSEHLTKLEHSRKQQQNWLILYGTLGLITISFLVYVSRYFYYQHQEQKTQAMTDNLTGLGNRLCMQQSLSSLFRFCKNRRKSMGLMFIDLDGFKKVNDKLGHQRGDQLLITIANRLTERLREQDLVIRYGGDEFVIAIPEVHKSHLLSIANNLMHSCSIELERNIKVSASIGISHYPTDADKLDKLIDQADKAMYQAKQAGKHCIRFWRPQESASEQLLLQA